MFQNKSEKRNFSQESISRVIYTVAGFEETQSIFHDIRYDNIQEFSANLNIQSVSKKFSSLSFQYCPKGIKGTALFLSVVNVNNDKLIVYCANNTGKNNQYIIGDCESLLISLWEELVNLTNSMVSVKPIVNDKFLITRSKSLLEQFALITTKALSTGGANKVFVEQLIKQFQIETDCFDNLLNLSTDISSELTC